MQEFEVLAANVAFLGETFSRGTIITKKKWQIQADAYNEKKAANAPSIDLDTVFAHMEERGIIEEVKPVTGEPVKTEEVEEVKEVKEVKQVEPAPTKHERKRK